MIELNAERTRRAMVEHIRRLAESAAVAGPDAAVPTAPKWTTADLVAHMGQTQNWVAEIIERRVTDPTQLPSSRCLSVELAVSVKQVIPLCSRTAI
ncbi:maleylpyruvate isomerase N-terminal domain-containing protein [Amycolatopsis sp. H20-H5]|uniref:maleylpyruvate isomerase N-terminal domain-containing protein n=1 Tax=Amycolatopsis sp. H20-H5 TaxID=3046309 RepID=UPI002DBFDC12|nr:maleylpyruvate isomerase N-terminal domain-containing protein [Amycolatopsis sp. H20-H5]MEC3975472.1 maleylpyruvate isomerase N-terminal domain-containing protein [Amycolatopsis sp. H20-H5]